MKCEICHNADAETAIAVGKEGAADELYVCNACAKKERLKRQKKSQRTRKVTGLPPGVSMSITEMSGDGEPPPIIEALIDAFNGMVTDIKDSTKSEQKQESASETTYHDFPVAKAAAMFRIGDRLHLEGLFLIGELEAIRRSLHALDMDLVGIDVDGVREVGHVYGIRYACSLERARRTVQDLLQAERNARVLLFEEMSRVFGDSLCRALAILKNCRMLSPAEHFDLLSPLRLAASEKMLDGITQRQIEKMLMAIDLTNSEETMTPEERDRADAERADEQNEIFEDVVLNERAEEEFL